MYFVRVQIAHLFEAFQVVLQISEDPILKTIVRDRDDQTRDRFFELLTYLPGGVTHAEFKQLIELVRHNLTFHYQSGKLIERAVMNRSAQNAIIEP